MAYKIIPKREDDSNEGIFQVFEPIKMLDIDGNEVEVFSENPTHSVTESSVKGEIERLKNEIVEKTALLDEIIRLTETETPTESKM